MSSCLWKIYMSHTPKIPQAYLKKYESDSIIFQSNNKLNTMLACKCISVCLQDGKKKVIALPMALL